MLVGLYYLLIILVHLDLLNEISMTVSVQCVSMSKSLPEEQYEIGSLKCNQSTLGNN